MSVVPQPTQKPKTNKGFRIFMIILVALFVVVGSLVYWAEQQRRHAVQEVASATASPSAATTPDTAKLEADKKVIETLAQVQFLDPSIEQDIIGQPELHVTVKNTTDKTIDGIVLTAHFKNNFGETVTDWGQNDTFRGNNQDTIQPGASTPMAWSLTGWSNATKVGDVKAIRVHFTDGTDVQDPNYSRN